MVESFTECSSVSLRCYSVEHVAWLGLVGSEVKESCVYAGQLTESKVDYFHTGMARTNSKRLFEAGFVRRVQNMLWVVRWDVFGQRVPGVGLGFSCLARQAVQAEARRQEIESTSHVTEYG